MGLYINAQNQWTSKEHWLKENAKQVSREEAKNNNKFEEDFTIVHLTNFAFTAAIVVYSQKEMDYVMNEDDKRPTTYYIAKKEDINQMCPLDKYIEIEEKQREYERATDNHDSEA